jgi:hypothetical protein
MRPNDDFNIAAALEDGEAYAEVPVTLRDVLDSDSAMEPEIDYVPDSELDLAIADGESLMHALTEGPILVAGNRLIN